ncbi:CDP-alcohol phosphatidyltransferase family protein [Leeia sp. TBRC 13508]|uniref:CDP-alcohol phosphatidyltransferase family protein n=1 Tax=Leeia speluncae TaxID=2884804 RepID=A0ABS8D6V6_9NEIS|nr:CDP-alcohol phosphatidyltransferase family protein [Leeia speluncae]
MQLISIYQLKPAFQSLLRPFVRQLAAIGVTANTVTLFAWLISVLLGTFLFFAKPAAHWFLLVPLWMLLRMALNAVDGMLAREFNQKSALGAYLNELTDVVADAALFLPFALISPFSVWSVGVVIWLAAVSEMTGALGPMIGAPRQYDGPMGKSDRAFIFGLLGLLIGLNIPLPQWVTWVLPACALLMVLNIVNRIRSGLRHSQSASKQ